MIALKIKLTQDSVGALHAEFIDGINSVSQNNAGKNIVEVILNGFELQTEEMLQIAYATSLNENDPETENIGFNFMQKRYDTNSGVAEVDPLVLDRRGVWYLGLRVVTETNGVIQTVSNETDMLEFTVNATLKDENGKYPTKGDVVALYQTAVNAVAQSGKVATETATQVASESAETVAEKKLTPVIQVANEQLGARLELLLNDKTYELYAILRAKNFGILSQQKVDLPLEEMIIDAYQNEGGNLVIILKNGQERTIELGALIKGLVSSSEKGQPNGVASLNAQGQVPLTQLPPLNYLPLTGGAVDGTVEAYDFIATSTGFYIGETSYEEGSIEHLSNSYAFPEKSGTLALREPIDTKFELINQIISQSGIMYTADNTASWNEQIAADGLNVLDGSKAILKKVVGNTVASKNLFNFDEIANNKIAIDLPNLVNYDKKSIHFTTAKNMYALAEYGSKFDILNAVLNITEAGTYCLRVKVTNANGSALQNAQMRSTWAISTVEGTKQSNSDAIDGLYYFTKWTFTAEDIANFKNTASFRLYMYTARDKTTGENIDCYVSEFTFWRFS